MKPAALHVLVCPICKGELELFETTRRGGEVLEGSLNCRACIARYPVVRGVPRFVSADSYAASFGYQWKRFRSVQLDSRNGRDESRRSFLATTGWTAAGLRGRRVLDAGVGAGRYAEVAAQVGAEVFGVDLTEAVDAAYENIGEAEGVHLVQADIFSMPFRDGTFDCAYSIGVLHHTPNPRAGFARVTASVKPGGGVAVYLYRHPGPSRYGPDLIRQITTRLPLPLVRALSTVAVPLYYLYRLPLLGRVLQFFCPISMHPDWHTRWLDTFDWYTPRYQWKLSHPQVFEWFRENGCVEIEIAPEPIRMRGVRAGAQVAAAIR
jgi:SAM-dependent methyltransferase